MSGIARRIALTETRRAVRVVAGDRSKILLNLGILVLAMGPLLAVGVLLLPAAGEAVAAGELEGIEAFSVVDVATGATALLWVGLVAMATIRTVTTVADLDEPACLLVSTSLRNVVGGLIGAETLLFAIWIGPPLVILSGAFASGAGSVLPVALAVALFGLLLATALPIGFVLGVWIRHALTVFEPIARFRTLVLVLVGVAYFGAIATGLFDALTASLFSLLAGSPVGWPGHLLLLAVPTSAASTTAIAGAVVGTVALSAAAFALGVVSARVHWYADAARTEDSVVTADSTSHLSRALSGWLDRPVRTVAVTAIRRTRRSPARLLYVGYPAFGAFFFVQDVVRTGTVPTVAAVFLALYVVWGAGALFTLNPLGDPGRALPAVLTSSVAGRQAIAGLVVAGAIVSVPVAILVGLVAGVASPLSLEATVLLVAGTVAGAIAAPALATGIGSVFPRFGSVRITSNREAVMPSKTAFLVYTLAIALPAGAAGLLYVDGAAATLATASSAILAGLADLSVTIPPSAYTNAAWTILPLGLLAPAVSVLYAIARFDRYAIE